MDYLLRLACSASFKHPHLTLLQAADRLFPGLWFSAVSLAKGNRQMVIGTSAKAVNPLEWAQSFVTGLRSDLHKVRAVLPS